MASLITIYNKAFLSLGLPVATSISDDTKAVRSANTIYELCKASLLESYNWNFATKRAVLAASTTTPTSGFSYQFILPSDFLKLLRLSDKSKRFRIENGFLLSDSSKITITYIANITDSTLFPNLFSDALGLSLAKALATQLTQSDALYDRISQEAEMTFRKAKKVDAQQGTPQRIEIYGLDNAAYGEDLGIFEGEIE